MAPQPERGQQYPVPARPSPSRLLAISGSRAQIALPGTTNRAERNRIRRTTGE